MSLSWKSTRTVLFNNFGWKLLSLAISLLLWAIIASEPDVATFVSVRVEYKNLPDDLEISSEPTGPVSLELRGPAGQLRALDSATRTPQLILDMRNVRAGESTFRVEDASIDLPPTVRLIRARPAQVRFTFERPDNRQIKVIPRFTGTDRTVYNVASWTAIPATVEIDGPASRVARVDAAHTDAIDLSGVVATKEFHVNIFVDDNYVRFNSPTQAIVRVTMKRN